MRLRLLVFALLLSAVTHADDVESVSESSELAEEAGMVSSDISAVTAHARGLAEHYFVRKLEYYGPWEGGILTSSLLTLQDDKCIQVEILWWAGAPKNALIGAHENRISDEPRCLKSEDGSLITMDSSTHWFTEEMRPNYLGFRGGDKHILDSQDLGSPSQIEGQNEIHKRLLTKVATHEELEQTEEFCNTSGCEAPLLVALVFAKANRNEFDGQSVSAAMHRLTAFDALDLQSMSEARSHRIQKTHFKDGLTLHAEALLKYSFDTEDCQLANEAKYILTRLEALDTETEARLNEWELNLESAVTPISVTLPLVAETPVSKYHYAVSKGLALKEFGITTDGVDLAYAFLQCSEKQVTLVTAARSAWVIPDDWEDCRLTLLSDEPTKATITEYPDGYVDRNGSLII